MATHSEKMKHLIKVMENFGTGMLVTHAGSSLMRGRPMAIARVDENADVYLATSLSSPKVQELMSDPRVAVMLQSKTEFVSLSGVATIERDRSLIERLWKESWKVWFPKGKEDPELCFIVVRPDEAEYWDNFGAGGLELAFQAAKAFVTGQKPPPPSDDTNAKVSV